MARKIVNAEISVVHTATGRALDPIEVDEMMCRELGVESDGREYYGGWLEFFCRGIGAGYTLSQLNEKMQKAVHFTESLANKVGHHWEQGDKLIAAFGWLNANLTVSANVVEMDDPNN